MGLGDRNVEIRPLDWIWKPGRGECKDLRHGLQSSVEHPIKRQHKEHRKYDQCTIDQKLFDESRTETVADQY